MLNMSDIDNKEDLKLFLKDCGVMEDVSNETKKMKGKLHSKWFKTFKKEFKIDVISCDEFEMEFDLIGIDAPIVNAIRRILLAEVPVMAVEQVAIHNNTSIVQDEELALRLGLIPIKVDPRLFEYRQDDDAGGTAEDTIKFQLNVTCTKQSLKQSVTSQSGLKSQSVYSREMEWVPIGNQAKLHEQGIEPVFGDILIAKLRPGHTLHVEMFCVKGIGKDHAKFSPVATAAYRLLPQIRLLEKITGEQAHRLASCFSEGVIEVEEEENEEVAKVVCARKDTCSRNVLRHEDLREKVELSKIKDHFIFTVESTGALSPDTLVLEAVNVLKEKCRFFLNEYKEIATKK